jgi:hypothetical protein
MPQEAQAPQSGPQQTEAEWWAEDAARLNEFCDVVAKSGHCGSVDAKQPKLNPDGTLADNQ